MLYIVIQTLNGNKTKWLTSDYVSPTYDLQAAIQVIGRDGVTVASKTAGQASLTIHV